MNKILYIVPIANFSLNYSESVFKHSHKYKNVEYSIRLTNDDRTVRDSLPNDKISEELYNKVRSMESIHERYRDWPVKLWFLIIKAETEQERNPFVEDTLTKAALDALRLHSSNGIIYDKVFRSFESKDVINPEITFWFTKPNGSKMIASSGLEDADIEPCKKTFDILFSGSKFEGSPIFEVVKIYKSNKTFNNVLKIALEYHETIFQLWFIEHRFLLLMIIFEALFKKEDEKYISDAADTFAKLVEPDGVKQKLIIKDFWNEIDKKDIKSFSVLRNMIAHGDPNFDVKRLDERYRLLYKYVTQGIIKVLHIPNEQIGVDDNYYDKLKQIANHEV